MRVLDCRGADWRGQWVDHCVDGVGDLLQADVNDQPTITVPGTWGTPDYYFLSAHDDHLYNANVDPLSTEVGSLLLAFVPKDDANQQTVFCLSEDGNANGEVLGLQFRGDVAGDPLEWNGRTGGATNLELRFPSAGVRVPHVVWLTSDGSTLRAYVNGQEQTVTANTGANTGQWFADYPDVDAVVAGAIRRAAVEEEMDMLMPVLVAYDRQVSYLDIQKQYQMGFGLRGPRWLPER